MPKHRNAARRSAARRSKRPEVDTGVLGRMLIMLAVVAAVVLGVAIFFRVHTVQVQGNSIYSSQQVAEVSGVEAGDNLLMVNRAEVVGNVIANLPYVQYVSVGRILPDTVVIRIEESQVAGLIKADVGSNWYINAEGRILGSSVDQFSGQIVELTGFTVTAPVAGEDARASEGMEENLRAALEILRQLDGTGLISQVSSVNTEATYDAKLLCGEQYEVQLGGTDELDYKIWLLQEVLKQLPEYQTGIIDLTLSQERAAHFIPWAEDE